MTDHLARSARNFFCAGSSERLAQWRRHAGWSTSALAHEDTRFVPVWRDRSLMREDGEAACLLSAADLAGLSCVHEDAVLLGSMDGHTCFAVELMLDEAQAQALAPRGAGFRDLRRNASLLSPRQAALLAYARAMLFWHRRHRFCGECGAPTRSEEAGHLRVCSGPDCGARHFPRTDPAIIVLTTDASGERCLLGRQAAWDPGMYSCLAGFVEPGESLEHAVVREVDEESGIRIARVSYRSSQPWPFPSSLMLGFRALAVSEAIQRGDDELEDARWFRRADLAAGYRDGSLRIPNQVSIAYRLIEEWFDEGPDSLSALLAELRAR
jgi:NAD+ diphosphatase